MSELVTWIRRESARLGLPLDDDDVLAVAESVERQRAALRELRSSSTVELEPPFTLRIARPDPNEPPPSPQEDDGGVVGSTIDPHEKETT